MDSLLARRLFVQHATAMAYIDVQLENGDRSIGSAFHVGEGVFVTARHVVEGNKIMEVRLTEPVGIPATEYFRDVLHSDSPEQHAAQYEAAFTSKDEPTPFFKHYIEPLEILEGPYFPTSRNLDVSVFRVKNLHHAAGTVKLGTHWDDWVYRGLWQLSDAIILGYPPIPMAPGPVLVPARAEIHTFVVPTHAPAVHFLLSATPRGGFSGGVAIHESGDALGVVTSSLVRSGQPSELGFFAVLSIEAIVTCLGEHNLYLWRRTYERLCYQYLEAEARAEATFDMEFEAYRRGGLEFLEEA
jgi:hypothetical protein